MSLLLLRSSCCNSSGNPGSSSRLGRSTMGTGGGGAFGSGSGGSGRTLGLSQSLNLSLSLDPSLSRSFGGVPPADADVGAGGSGRPRVMRCYAERGRERVVRVEQHLRRWQRLCACALSCSRRAAFAHVYATAREH